MNRTTPLLLAAFVALALLAGCGSSAYRAESSPAPHEPAGSVDEYAARIERLERELSAELRSDRAPTLRPDRRPPIGEPEAEPGPPPRRAPDCRAAPALRRRICELSNRICSIAERDASDHALAETCERAREACARATLRVEHACGG